MNKPTLWKVFRGDYVVGNGLPFVIIVTGLGIYFIVDSSIDIVAAYISFGLAALFLITTIIRIKKIYNLFATGIELKATVINMWHYRSSARIVTTYQYDTQDIKGTYNAHRSTYTKSLSLGANVKVLINPNKPNKCIVKDVFN